MPNMRSWGLPTDPVQVPVLGEIYFGDHTWVTADDRSCWNVLGGGPGFYCADSRWQGNTYVPPTIKWRGRDVTGRELSVGTGMPSSASCMGGTAGEVCGIPTYAGIIYGIHGVCHQMANRLLLTSGRTVEKAEGFTLSSAAYGIYGTWIPGWVWWSVVLSPALAAFLAGYVIGMNVRFAVDCDHCGVPYPGPVLASGDGDAEERLVREVLALHRVGTQPPAAAPEPEPAMIREAVRTGHARHLRELDLLLAYRSRGRIAETKLALLRERLAELTRPAPDAVALVTEAARAPAAEVEVGAAEREAIVVEANRGALALQEDAASILGADDFKTLFGPARERPVGLVDPRIMHRR